MQNPILIGNVIFQGTFRVTIQNLIITIENIKLEFESQKFRIIYQNRDIGELDYSFQSDRILDYFDFKLIEIVEFKNVQNWAPIKVKMRVSAINKYKQPDLLPSIKQLIQDSTYVHNNLDLCFVRQQPQDIEELTQPKGIKTELKDYQLEALNWMLKREKNHDLSWMQFRRQGKREQFLLVKNCNGGILAYEEGLGQKLTLISLIDCHYRGKTLIVQTVKTKEWEDAFKAHCKTEYKIAGYIGKDKNNINIDDYDIVITKYNIIRKIVEEKKYNPILSYNWSRIILDDAHKIKNDEIQTSRAIFKLTGQYKWCVTTSPFQNSLSELYSFICYLNFEPWSTKELWNFFISIPERKSKEYDDDGLKYVKNQVEEILQPIMLRRKNHRNNLITPVVLQFSGVEQQLYDECKIKYGQIKIIQDQQQMIAELITNEHTLNIKLRQLCDHPSMPNVIYITKDNNKIFRGKFNKFFQGQEIGELYEQLQTDDSNNILHCFLCNKKKENTIITICKHFFCKSCIRQFFKKEIKQNQLDTEQQIKRECPQCKFELEKTSILVLMKKTWKFDETYESSTKLDKIIEIVNNLKDGDKCIIFSYYLEMLELIKQKLPNDSYLQLKGGSAQLLLKKRQKRAKIFRKSKKRIMLIQSNIRLNGIDLSMANHIILVDPWWNPQCEKEILKVVKNEFQLNEVHVHKFIMKDTVEEEILNVQKKKIKLSQNYQRI